MRHPFDLELSELETIEFNLLEELTDEEAATIAGGYHIPPTAGSEPSGGNVSSSLQLSEDGVYFTTLMLGEEGGNVMTTLALGEEGGDGLE
jgi:hypothetical protein